MSIAIVGGGFLGSAVAAASADPVLVVTRSGRRRRGTATDVVALDVLRAPIDEVTSTLGRARKLVIAIAPTGTISLAFADNAKECHRGGLHGDHRIEPALYRIAVSHERRVQGIGVTGCRAPSGRRLG